MNEKNKVVLIIISVLLITGCSAKYSLNISTLEISELITINNDKIIVEKNNNMIKTFNKDYGKYYDINFNDDLLIDCYDREIEDCSQYEKNYPLVIEGYNKMNQIQDIEDSKAIKDFFGIATITGNTNTTINIKPNEKLKMIFSKVNFVSPFITSLEVSIFTPFQVSNHNADKVEKNTYTWTYNKDNIDKVITISYDTSNSDDTIIDNNKENESNKENNQTDNTVQKSNNSVNKYIFWGIAFSIIIIIGVIILKKMKSNDSV